MSLRLFNREKQETLTHFPLLLILNNSTAQSLVWVTDSSLADQDMYSFCESKG